MKQVIMSHNRKILKTNLKDECTKSGCRNTCVLNGACRYSPIVYKATLEHSSKTAEDVSSTKNIEDLPRISN